MKFKGSIPGPVAYALRTTAIAVAYFVIAWLCLKFTTLHHHVPPIWLPSGFAIGTLYFLGRRYASGVFIGAFALSLSTLYFAPESNLIGFKAVIVAAAIALGSFLEAFVGASFVKKFCTLECCLNRVNTLFGFILFAAIIAPLLETSIGIAALTIGGILDTSDLGHVFLTWYTRNVIGILVLTPPIICFFSSPCTSWLNFSWELTIQLLAVLMLGLLIWGPPELTSISGFPHVYMMIPLFLWASLRLGKQTVMLSTLLLSIIAVTGTINGKDVFSSSSCHHSLIYLQIYIGILAIMGLSINALVTELRTSNKQLKTSVTNRTIQLEQLLREKDDFLAIAVHDLQSPLAGLRNLIRLLRKNPKALQEPASSGLLQEMDTTTDQMLIHVGELLSTQQLNDTCNLRTPRPENLKSILEQSIRMKRPNAMAKNISIHLELPRDTLQAMTHRESLQHVLDNLLSNAIKYTPPGKSVRVALSHLGSIFRFEVYDEGPGIPADQNDRIFNKYQRGNAIPTGGEDSTGIGLYIVDRLVTELGGKIHCRAEEEGSCFILDLPADPIPR